MENKKEPGHIAPWIEDPEDFQKLERSIWAEIDQSKPDKKKCPLKELARNPPRIRHKQKKQSRFKEDKDDLGFSNVVAIGPETIIIG